MGCGLIPVIELIALALAEALAIHRADKSRWGVTEPTLRCYVYLNRDHLGWSRDLSALVPILAFSSFRVAGRVVSVFALEQSGSTPQHLPFTSAGRSAYPTTRRTTTLGAFRRKRYVLSCSHCGSIRAHRPPASESACPRLPSTRQQRRRHQARPMSRPTASEPRQPKAGVPCA
jgi:hypothetical protein